MAATILTNFDTQQAAELSHSTAANGKVQVDAANVNVTKHANAKSECC